MSLKKYIIATASSLLVSGLVQATPLITASDISFGELLIPIPAQSTYGAPATARGEFLNKLNGTAGSHDFENNGIWNLADTPLGVRFNNGTTGTGANVIDATLAGTGQVGTATGGRFNTTAGGSRFLQVSTGTEFTLSFSTAIAAFGFYGTDIGDFGGVLSLILTPWNGGPDETLVVRPQSNQAAASGALLFYGFADMSSEYRRITFVSLGTTSDQDFFGFDDLVVADRGQIRVPTTPPGVPEPGSLALAGLALFAAGYARKARKAA